MESVVQLHGRRYVLRPLAAHEVAQVNGMLRAEYGPCYPYPLCEDRLTLRGVYIVCVDDRHEIVAFAKAEYREPHGFYEVGGLIIAPAHRVAGLGSCIVQHCVDETYRRGAKIVFAEPVCYRNDHASQKLFLRRGFGHCAVEPFKYPHIQLQHLGAQPETVTVCVLPPPGGVLEQGHALFVPADYASRLERLLERPLASGRPVLLAHRMPRTVDYAAIDFEGYLGATFRDVPANWPEAQQVIDAARAEGFCLSGVLPGFGRMDDGTSYDYVRLYRPSSGFRPDFSLVHVVPALLPFLDGMRAELAHRYG